MEEYSYINALLFFYYNVFEKTPRKSASGKKLQFFKRIPELKTLEKTLNESEVLKGMFLTTIKNIIDHMPRNAIFFADKLKTLTDNNPLIIYLLGESFFLNGNFKKIYYTFTKFDLLHKNNNYLILASKGLIKNKDFKLCQEILEESIKKEGEISPFTPLKYLLLAQCLEENENKQEAQKYYIECLKKDPYCVEAFMSLMDSHTLERPIKEDVIKKIDLKPKDVWLKTYYESYIKKMVLDENKNTMNTDREFNIHNFLNFKSKKNPSNSKKSENKAGTLIKKESKAHTNSNKITPENTFSQLTKRMNLDILCINAKNAYSKYNINKAYQLSIKIIEEDPLKLEILPIYCCCLLEKEDYKELYKVALMLMDHYPKHPISHYSVGLYHFLLKKYDLARRYFKQANSIDKNYIYSWIGMGHSFAIHDEADHAMGAYRSCQRLFPGNHLPHLYLGMEYLRTNNLSTAQLSFEKAKTLNKEDPIVYNEIGVTHYKKKEYIQSNEFFSRAMRLCNSETADWILEDIYNNMGHCMRKIGNYKNAIKQFKKCLHINPKNDSVLYSLAFTYHISGQLAKAKEYYFKMMNYQSENQFANEMLTLCLNDLTQEESENVIN